MIQIKLFKENKYIHIPLQQYLDEYHSTIHPAWSEYMDWVNEGLNINNDREYQAFIKKMNINKWDLEKVCDFYTNLQQSELAELFDDDILKFISHLYGIGYFRRVGNPNVIDWINIKGVFKPNRDSIPDNEKYSLKDLTMYTNGLNAVKYEMLFALKW